MLPNFPANLKKKFHANLKFLTKGNTEIKTITKINNYIKIPTTKITFKKI